MGEVPGLLAGRGYRVSSTPFTAYSNVISGKTVGRPAGVTAGGHLMLADGVAGEGLRADGYQENGTTSTAPGDATATAADAATATATGPDDATGEVTADADDPALGGGVADTSAGVLVDDANWTAWGAQQSRAGAERPGGLGMDADGLAWPPAGRWAQAWLELDEPITGLRLPAGSVGLALHRRNPDLRGDGALTYVYRLRLPSAVARTTSADNLAATAGMVGLRGGQTTYLPLAEVSRVIGTKAYQPGLTRGRQALADREHWNLGAMLDRAMVRPEWEVDFRAATPWVRGRADVVWTPAGALLVPSVAEVPHDRLAVLLAARVRPDGVTLVADGWTASNAAGLGDLFLEVWRAMPEALHRTALLIMPFAAGEWPSLVERRVWRREQSVLRGPSSFGPDPAGRPLWDQTWSVYQPIQAVPGYPDEAPPVQEGSDRVQAVPGTLMRRRQYKKDQTGCGWSWIIRSQRLRCPPMPRRWVCICTTPAPNRMPASTRMCMSCCSPAT